MSAPLLEVIALNAVDAKAAEAGGADRLELVSDIAADGLTPLVETVADIRAACDLKLRVMLRLRDDFATDDLAELVRVAPALAAAGADGFVLGFLTPTAMMDIAAMRTLAAAGGLPWTCHRAIDRAADFPAAFDAVRALPGLDQVLTAGSRDGIPAGLESIAASTDPGLVMAGGGMRPEHVAPLRRMGVRAFHIGSGARTDWATPVRSELVANWRAVIDG